MPIGYYFSCHHDGKEKTGPSPGISPGSRGRPYGCLDDRTFPCDSYPIVGATLVVALPLQATEIDRGHPVSPTS